MISPQYFVESLKALQIDFFTGVPDSLLKNVCAYIGDNICSTHNIIAANEGAAIGLAAGYYLSTKKIPVVYMQNSGIGNAINPLMSLTDKEVYNIPLLLLIGWRGEPSIKDELAELRNLMFNLSNCEDTLPTNNEVDINKLNKAWWTSFWSHTYNDFSQIEPPYANGEFSIMGLNLEWKRFTTWNTTDYMKSEIEILKRRTPNIPVTTNFMQLFPGLDYRVMAKELDVISWDSYPFFHNNYETFADTMARSSFDHAVMRSMKKDQPYMLMESAPGLANWHRYNKLKRPGVHKLFSAQAVGCGSDTVQYFQWRKSRGAFEQFHGAVVDHLGTDDTRIFKEVAKVGEMLDNLSKVKGTLVKPKAALLFDWDNMWAIENMRGLSDETKNYPQTCADIYHEFLKLGIDMNVVASDDNLDDYNVVVAPMLYMLRPGTADNLKKFVKRGGQLLATYLTGYVDDNTLCFLGGFPGNGLSELFGLISEEIDTLYDCDINSATFTNGNKAKIRDYAEILRVSDADVIARYDSDFYAGTPVVTRKTYGDGKSYYVAARLDMNTMSELFKTMLEETETPYYVLPDGIEYHKREDENGDTIEFYLNVTDKELSFSTISGDKLTLEPYGVKIF